MESIFRFVIARPATAVDAEDAISLERDSELQRALASAHDQARPGAAMRSTAEKFAAGNAYVRDPALLNLGAGFAAMRDGLTDTTPAGDLGQLITGWFGSDPQKVIGSNEFRQDEAALADSLIAIKLLAAEQRQAAVARLADAFRHASLIRRVANLDPTLNEPGGVARARRRPLALPARLFPIPPDRSPRGPAPGGPRADTGDARANVDRLLRTLDELMALEAPTAAIADPEPALADGADGARPAVAAAPARAAMMLRPAAVESLSATTRSALAARRLDPAGLPLDQLVNNVAGELAIESRQLALRDPAAIRTVGLVGRTPVLIEGIKGGPPTTSQAGIPTSHGNVRPVGVADLLLVKQQLKRYEARDIAHVENVLQGESKRREHMRSVMTEQLTITEIERVKEQERELESTERFEMSRAASETISQQAALVTGLTVSGSYGPTVDFEASVQGALEQARERSVETASSYSREITERSRTRISETVREQRSLRIVNTVSETNEHAIDNTSGNGHVVGIYQWLEKVYEAQIFNYGLRALFDFTIPEPATFAIHAMKAGFADTTQVVKPRDFDITPAQINEANYHGFVRDWEATGVSPPPDPFVTVAKTFRGGPDAPDAATRGMFVDAVELPLPDGYRALSATAVSRWGHWDADPDMTIRIALGRHAHTWVSGASTTWTVTLDSEVGSLALGVRTWRVSSFITVCEVLCQRTQRAMDKWRIDTHAALLQAYQAMRAKYEEKLKALRAKAGIEIGGRNPALNREIERRELKKICVEMLTAQHFQMFNSIETGSDGLPQTNVPEAGVEGPYIRFFEQAFEWQNATWVFYPYMWGRRSTWVERFNYDDVDPLFAAFLNAGAARVVVPARPGFELAIDHFMQTGEVWQGGELPPITSETYVPIVEELAEQLGAPGDEVPHGDPWEVHVPTSLVLLRQTPDLPRWRKNDDGEWVPDEA